MPIDTDNPLPDWRPNPLVGESDMEGDKGVDPDDNAPGGEQPIFRPHAFALSHGNGGAKVAYGELHWRVDVLKFKFETHTVSGISVTVDDHANHSHAPHADHSHSDHTNHSHADHTNHEHSTPSHTHTGTTDGASGGGYTGGPHTHTFTTNSNNTDHTGGVVSTTSSGSSSVSAEDGVLGHSSVTTTSHGTPASNSGILDHSNAVNTDGSSLGADSAGVLKHSGVTTLDSSNQGTSSDASGSSSGVLSHNVTVSGSSSFVYCAQVGQESIGKINQQVPKVDAEDGNSMDATTPNIYHQLGAYGDVYLCWKANLEQGAGSEVTHCWVQVGEPNNDDIDEVPLGNSTTDRRNSNGSDGITGANDNGIYSIKLGTVQEGDEITQKVSSDVVWSPTVMDRIGP